MGKKFGVTFYIILFSVLGLFSFLLLVNSSDIQARVNNYTNIATILVVYLISFNITGFSTLKLSSWIRNQYSRNIKKRWKILLMYSSVSLILLMINFGLLVTVKFAANNPNPLIFGAGDGLKIFIVVWLFEIVIMGLLLVNRSINDTLKMQQQLSELKKENDKVQYTALQNQLNPHFLFNTLNTLIAEIEYDPKNAVTFTNNLASVYRYVLQVQDKTLVTLRDELEFTRSYLFLHKVRIGGYIDYNQNVSNEYLDWTLPPLTLQLLFENILKHNSITEKNRMAINIFSESDYVVVSNSVNLKKNSLSNGVGLKNLSARCKLMLGRDIEIRFDDKNFEVKIPINNC